MSNLLLVLVCNISTKGIQSTNVFKSLVALVADIYICIYFQRRKLANNSVTIKQESDTV